MVRETDTPARRDRIVWRDEVQKRIGTNGVSGKTMSRYIISGTLPPPDVYINQKKMGWRVSTLAAAGLGGVFE